MRILIVLTLVFIVGSLPTIAESQENEARQTAVVLKKLYDSIDSEMGAYLYEPRFVLCLGGQLTQTSSYNYKIVGQPDFGRLNSLCQELGVRFKQSGSTFGLQSKKALAKHSAESKLEWVEPFAQEGDWEDFESWETKNRERFRNASFKHSDWERWNFLAGSPDSAIVAERALRDYSFRLSLTVSADVACANFLDGRDANFYVPLGAVNAPDCLARRQEWSDFLTAFYGLPEVRSLLSSSEFGERRRKLRPKGILPKTEAWLRKEVVYQPFSSERSFRTKLPQERVLLAHKDDLATLIADPNITGPEIGSQVYQWGLEASPPVQMNLDSLFNWIWTGGYKVGTHRDEVYESLLKSRPDLLSQESKRQVSAWLEQTPKKEDPNAILRLFRHTAVKDYFRASDQNTQDEIRARMENASFDRRVRILLGQPPYAL